MANILAVGIATLDIVNLVDHYPAEDEELRALAQQRRRGGNATNTLVVLSQLGHRCAWAGTLAAEPDAGLILADLGRHDIDVSAVRTLPSGKVPTSYIALSRATGSRTIVHHRDLPEYTAADFTTLDLSLYEWLHFEGRNVAELESMLRRARALLPGLPLSLEVEKPRPGIEGLFPLVDLLLFSKGYAQHRGYAAPEPFLQAMQRERPGTRLVCGWGERGAWAVDERGDLHHCPAFPPPQVVDTLGAGDTFNAGIIDALVRGQSVAQGLEQAARLAGRKCGVEGLVLS